MEVAGWIQKIIRDDKPAKVNIDVGGLGIGVYACLSKAKRSMQSISVGSRSSHRRSMKLASQPADHSTEGRSFGRI
jgi:hypothetical protein